MTTKATAQAVDADEWLHTAISRDSLRRLLIKITGRARDMIIRGGENVYPREIEEVLKVPQHIRFVDSYAMPLSSKVQKFKMRGFEIATRCREAIASE